MRVAILGGGTIARLFLEHIRRGDLGDAEVVAIVGRSEQSRGKQLAAEFGVAFVTTLGELLTQRPDVVVEAASHEAVRLYCDTLLDAGVAVIVLSGGALCDDKLRARLKVVADPTIMHNTHQIAIRGKTGNISIKLENVPAPENPKTAWLACYSALAALKLAKSPVRYGT